MVSRTYDVHVTELTFVFEVGGQGDRRGAGESDGPPSLGGGCTYHTYKLRVAVTVIDEKKEEKKKKKNTITSYTSAEWAESL